MKRFDPRILIGTLLILAGALGFLQAFGYLEDASDLFWGIVFLGAGAVFLFLFASGYASGGWWAAFPGFVLAGIGVLIFVIRSFGAYPDGVAFAVLLMNSTVPLIDRYTAPRVFGHRRGHRR